MPATFAAGRQIPPSFQFAATFLRHCHFPARGCRCYNLLVAGRGGVISRRSRLGFIAHKRRYGAGVSTSGSQPENPGSIPGTATIPCKTPSGILRPTACSESQHINATPAEMWPSVHGDCRTRAGGDPLVIVGRLFERGIPHWSYRFDGGDAARAQPRHYVAG